MAFGRNRLVLTAASCQITCGVLLWILAAIEIWLIQRGICQDYTTGTIVTGLLHVVAGSVGVSLSAISYKSNKSPRKESTLLIIYVIVSAGVVVPLMVHGQLKHCGSNIYNPYYSIAASVLAVFILKLVISYIGLFIAVVGTAFACQRICSFNNRMEGQHQSPSSHADPAEEEGLIPPRRKSNSKPTLQLPEAKTHIQEAPGSGERVTVVTLPEAEGVVYAVPEQCYVVKRGDATYLTPNGDHRWTKFFPSYKRVEAN